MRILFVGDVVGRSGRQVLLEHITGLKEKLKLDALVVNAENAAGGFGLTPAIAQEFFQAGVDVITLGNHAWDQRELITYIDQEPRIVRPLNCLPGTPGRGVAEHKTASGKRLVVIQVMGRLFMGMQNDATKPIEKELSRYLLGGNVDAIILDVHAEATSEKAAYAYLFDGKISLVAGTHTHIPTADHRILPKGTAFISDVGMTGDYESVIGMQHETAARRWQIDIPGPRLQPASGPATLCSVLVETDRQTGKAASIRPIRLGGVLEQYPL